MEIIKNIKNSVYGPAYYKEILVKPFSYSLKYYFLFALIISTVVTFFMAFSVVPAVKSFADFVLIKAAGDYPQDLIINIEDGNVSTNVSEPYFIKMPADLKKITPSDAEVNGVPASDFLKTKNLLVIDTKNNFSVAEFNSYDTAVLLTKDSVIYPNKGTLVVQPLKNINNFSINKPEIISLANKAMPFVKFAYPIVIIFVWIFRMFILMANLFYLLFAALLIWLVAIIKKMKIGYWKSYKYGLHLMTLGIILNSVFYLTGLLSFAWFSTALLILLAIINIKKLEPAIQQQV